MAKSVSALLREAYVDGRYSSTGFASYFVKAFFYKTTIPAMLLIAAVAGAAAG